MSKNNLSWCVLIRNDRAYFTRWCVMCSFLNNFIIFKTKNDFSWCILICHDRAFSLGDIYGVIL